MKFKLILLLMISVFLSLSACGYSNTMEDTSDTHQHSSLRGVITDLDHINKKMAVEGENMQVNLRVTESSKMVDQLEEVIDLEDLKEGLKVSVSWGPKESEEQNQVNLEKLWLLED
ncbi:hypothetical protein [Alkalibacillus haloalkaliphilus]|uniref:hypothetical protein n=1 Tax=Alkalibacillus haloalkaliphilus TaxID=94136 RepID=UPI000375B81C|nr:hypothetical protein [Alkalibacillus haloalkaliphilus]